MSLVHEIILIIFIIFYSSAIWENWSEWGSCDKTCGTDGIKLAERSCRHGRAGGYGCLRDGNNNLGSKEKACNRNICRRNILTNLHVIYTNLAIWKTWSGWGICTKSCGTGTQTASRICLNGTPGQIGCQRDNNDNLNTRQQNCNEQDCRKFIFAENNSVHI